MKIRLLLLPIIFLAVLSAFQAAADPFDISLGDEIQAGKEAASWIERNLPLSKDPVLTAKIEGIGRRLTQAAERKDLKYEFHVIAQPEVNAFALPGGYIYLYQGLIQILPSEDALAFVVAHEMVHAAKRHWAGMMKKATTLSVLSLGHADILNLFLVPAYSRDAEREADSMALRMLSASGYDPNGSVQAMSALMEIAGKGRKGLPIFRSHPATDTRLSYLKKMAEEAKSQPKKPAAEMAAVPASDVPIMDFGELKPIASGPSGDFPLAEGDTWVYRFINEKGSLVRQTVVVAEQLPDSPGFFRLESRLDGKIVNSYIMVITESGIMRRPIAKNGLYGWEMMYVLPSSKQIPQGFRISPPEEVETPFGVFQAYKVERLDSAGSPIRTAWLAQGVGVVKESVANGPVRLLERFKPGRAVPAD